MGGLPAGAAGSEGRPGLRAYTGTLDRAGPRIDLLAGARHGPAAPFLGHFASRLWRNAKDEQPRKG